MAIINHQTAFNADRLPGRVIGIAADVGQHDSGMHQHHKGQLLYAPKGCMSFALEGAICILPPTKAVWIPPRVAHQAVMTNVVAYRSLYFDCSEINSPDKVTVIEVNELLRALIERMAFWPWDKNEQEMTHTLALFWEEFFAAQQHDYRLPLPSDRRLKKWSQQLARSDFLAPSCGELAKQVGASSKTITRLFKQDTGISYQEWRQQWRVLKAIELLSTPLPVSEVAHQLAFSSDSAFIAFFKKQTGQTPLAFVMQKSHA
ncbi:TPA: helix-turn-helix domain-containing protein [Vibrio vulnificus]|nr:helix-turn-helix domain-containing protein [Vibrio vulnificus]HDY7595682.1 helix-turn-helix transcriptional regulator [Vibrio vulnificus]